jgi:hypothetical protein
MNECRGGFQTRPAYPSALHDLSISSSLRLSPRLMIIPDNRHLLREGGFETRPYRITIAGNAPVRLIHMELAVLAMLRADPAHRPGD